jgi:shikimate dehydrogenase
MSAALRRACLMGHPVAHSRSPMIHNYWLTQLGIPGIYELKDLLPEKFEPFVVRLAENGYVGGNVTVPHKEAAFRLASSRDVAAEAVGAVNVLWLENGKLAGGNSDTHGFIANLDERAPGWNVPGCRALVLGAGGAGRSAVYTLLQRGVEIHLVNRTVARAEELARRLGARVPPHGWEAVRELLSQAVLLFNCTSPGLAGKVLSKTPMAGAGETAEVTLTVPGPGTYPFVCTFPGHFMAGMAGTLVVQ